MELTLQPATPEHLHLVLTWVTTPELLKLWGGATLTFPPLADRIWHEIGATGQNTFSLMDPEGAVVGFGQTILRESITMHLARIIVSPTMRGKGLGRILCRLLMQRGATCHQVSQFTLSVYKNNTPALNLYTSLGFTAWFEDRDHNALTMGLRLPPSVNLDVKITNDPSSTCSHV